MATLKGAIESAAVAVADWRPPGDLATHLRAFECAVDKIVEPFNSLNAKSREGVDLEELVRRAMNHGIGPDIFNRWEFRDLTGALWQDADGRCIAENRPLLNRYLREVLRQKRPSHFNGLATAYLREYAPDRPGISVVAAALRELLEVASPKWAERHRRWDIFGPNAPGLIAEFFLDTEASEQAMGEAAKEIGLDSLIQGGMSRVTFSAAMLKYGGNPNIDSLRRLTAWRRFAAADSGGFCDKEYAEGLLLPWCEREELSKEVKTETRNTLLDRGKYGFGDPRLGLANSAKWFGVSETAKAVILHWLVEVALAEFFRVMGKAALTGEGAHMWEPRKRFWFAFYKRGVLQEAWVAFSSAGSAYLRGSREDVSYAQIDGAQNNHAVLLMTIGDLIIADWNLNGKCHIWHKGSRGAPVFYKARYSAYALGRGNFSSDKSFVHHAGGRWRYEIAAYIQEWTGIDIPPREYS